MSDWECQLINVDGGNLCKKLILGNIYRPPRGTIDHYKKCVHELTDTLNYFENSNSEVVIAGDFNINLLDIDHKDIVRSYFNGITSECFFPMITLPTRFSTYRGTLIDNFISKYSDTMFNAVSGILLDKFSDHQPYFTSLELVRTYQTTPKYIRVYDKSEDSLEKFSEEFNLTNFSNVLDKSSWADPTSNYNIFPK